MPGRRRGPCGASASGRLAPFKTRAGDHGAVVNAQGRRREKGLASQSFLHGFAQPYIAATPPTSASRRMPVAAAAAAQLLTRGDHRLLKCPADRRPLVRRMFRSFFRDIIFDRCLEPGKAEIERCLGQARDRKGRQFSRQGTARFFFNGPSAG